MLTHKKPLIILAALLILAVIGFQNQNATADDRAGGVNPDITIGQAISAETSQPLRDLPNVEGKFDPTLIREINPRHNPNQFEPDMGRRGTWGRTDIPTDPLITNNRLNSSTTPALDLDFEGINGTTGCGGCSPPDVVGDVGPNHYVQMVNSTKIAVYNKSGTLIDGPKNLGTLWSSGQCTSNAGDPIVLYDGIADRWLITQFANPTHMCFAVSTTPDPTGSYHTYTYDVGAFPDYFKLGVWPDGYYMSANESSYTAYAFDRAKMLVGDTSASFIKKTGYDNLLLPSDLDGATLPPADAPNYFYTFLDNSYHGGSDRLEIYEFDVDWSNPGASTFTNVVDLPVSAFTYTACGFFNFNCIRQQGSSQRFDSLGEWPMFRFPYRNFGTHETLVGTFGVGGGNGEEGSALRWFELRKTGNQWAIHQQGTHDPSDGLDRFNASIAMDGCGNIALGYQVSSSDMYPSIRYTSRLAGDPLGTMGTEASLIEGTAANTTSGRWGDYSAMSVDPANDTQFWYTGEVFRSGLTNWRTHIGAFTVCTDIDPDFTILASPATLDVCPSDNAVYGVDITGLNGFSNDVSLSASGGDGTISFSTNPVTPDGSSNMTVAGASAGNYTITITGEDTTNSSLTHDTSVDLNVLPGGPSDAPLNSPTNGATDVSTTVTLEWNAAFNATDYLVEVASDSGFTNIIDSATVSSTSYDPSGLAPSFTYYWRVTASNTCATAAASETWSFSTVAAPTCENILLEPSFEAGANSAWNESSSNGYVIVDEESPRTGNFSAWMGGANNETAQVWQSAEIAANASSATLTYNYNIDSNDTCGSFYDEANVQINGSNMSGHRYDLCSGTDTGGSYAQETIDMAAYIGTTPEIRFVVETDVSFASDFYVDDVTLEVCIEPVPSSVELDTVATEQPNNGWMVAFTALLMCLTAMLALNRLRPVD